MRGRNSTSTPTASKIPIADASAKLDAWISDATALVKGIASFASGDFSVSSGAVSIKKVHARVYNNAAIAIPNNTWTALTFNSERVDTDGMHSTSSNTSRLTCKTAGFYIFGGGASFVSNGTGDRASSIRLNGSTYITPGTSNTGTSPHNELSSTTGYYLNIGDYAEFMVW